jgi:hypothetical protein
MKFSYHVHVIVFILLITSLHASAMKPHKPQAAVKIPSRAQEFLNKITKENKLSLNKAQLIKYLHKRIKNSSFKGADRTQELSVPLSRYFCLYFVINTLDTDAYARITYYFPAMVEENLALTMRKELGCYTQDLTVYEQEYASTLKQVTSKEYQKRLKARFKKKDIHTMLLVESEKFAEEIVLTLVTSNKE